MHSVEWEDGRAVGSVATMCFAGLQLGDSLKESCLLWWKYHHGMRYTVRVIVKILRTLLWTSLVSAVALRARKILALDLDLNLD